MVRMAGSTSMALPYRAGPSTEHTSSPPISDGPDLKYQKNCYKRAFAKRNFIIQRAKPSTLNHMATWHFFFGSHIWHLFVLKEKTRHRVDLRMITLRSVHLPSGKSMSQHSLQAAFGVTTVLHFLPLSQSLQLETSLKT